MKNMIIAGLAAFVIAGSTATAADMKNWTPPAFLTNAQALSNATMHDHPELLSMTLHGVPPGMDKTYTMFAGSYPDRIGNADDPDDIDVIVKGITIVDPRWHRTKDAMPKFVVQLPLRDAAGNNIGLVVYAFHVSVASNAGEREFYAKALDLRDALATQTPSYAALFERAR